MEAGEHCIANKVVKCLSCHNVKEWRVEEIDDLVSVISEYCKQVNENKQSTVASSALSFHAACEQSNNVEIMAKALDRIRAFIKSKVSFGSLHEPTRVHWENGSVNENINNNNSDNDVNERESKSVNLLKTNNVNKKREDNNHVPPKMSTPVYSIDSFLYREEDIDFLVEQKLVSRTYCVKCGSTEMAPTEFITHSFSEEELIYLSCFLLPSMLAVTYEHHNKNDICNNINAHLPTDMLEIQKCQQYSQTIVDVGSRFGVVLWAVAKAFDLNFFNHTRLERVIGIEKDVRCVKLQNAIRSRFFSERYQRFKQLSRKRQRENTMESSTELETTTTTTLTTNHKTCELTIDIRHADCFDKESLETLASADVIILHNVFEYFCHSPTEHLRCWLKLRECVHRSGQLIVCAPSLNDTFSTFSETTLYECGLLKNTKQEVNKIVCKEVESKPLSEQQEEHRLRASKQKCAVKSNVEHITHEWIESYVEEVDVSEIATAFFDSYFSTKSHTDNVAEDNHHHHHNHHTFTSGKQEKKADDDDKTEEEEEEDAEEVDSFEEELIERVNNIHVYQVK